MRKIIICEGCKKLKPHAAKGLCYTCYKRPLITCSVCRKIKPHKAKGMCQSCYNKQNLIICKKCGLEKPHNGNGLCKKCNQKQNLIICKECGELKPHNAKGLCQNCYRKQNTIICKECGKLKLQSAKGLCITCYSRLNAHKTGKNKPMSENKECTLYLGVEITEKLLLKRFKNAKQMHNNNKNYDFMCDKGYKIDAKSSCLRFDKRRPDIKKNWIFHINKNKVADYFCCVGYDNREDLNVIKAWLIPSDAISKKGIIINNLTGISIPKNNNKFWKQYEMDIDILDNYCTKMKEKY